LKRRSEWHLLIDVVIKKQRKEEAEKRCDLNSASPVGCIAVGTEICRKRKKLPAEA
jgi:hypothetical protein